VHDFTGGITPAGLVWTVRLPDHSVSVDAGGNVVTVDARDVAVVDERQDGDTDAHVTLQMTWTGRGRRRRTVTSPAFAGDFFRRARARAVFAASEDGFAFASDPRKRLRTTFAELGTERNGVFLPAPFACAACEAR
jgi:hypothetical protein